MFKNRKLLILAILLLIAVAIGLVLYYRTTQVPEAAGLLPEGDTVFFANIKPLRVVDLKNAEVGVETLLAVFGISPTDYRDFSAQTGIKLEQDLDEAAMSRRDTSDGRDVESSEILIGHFDQDHLKTYLQKFSSGTEQYRNIPIYFVDHAGHLVRVAQLAANKIAVTNMNSPEPMHGIIDRSFKSAAGPSLLKEHYHDVPLGTVAWLIDRIPNKQDNIQLPGGFALTIPGDSVAVGSLRYTGSLLFRADIFAQSESQAKQIVDSANAHLTLVRSIGQIMGTRGTDKDIKAAFDSIEATQKENVATFTATVPQTILKKIWSEAQQETASPAPASTPTPAPAAEAAPHKHRHRR